jgi:hypothetical protein
MLLSPVLCVRGLMLSSISEVKPLFGQIGQMSFVAQSWRTISQLKRSRSVIQVIVSLTHGVSSPTKTIPHARVTA